MIRTALEWYDQNMHTNYPIAGGMNAQDSAVGQSVDGQYLPESFLVDIRINVPDLPEADAQNRFYVSSVSSADDMVVLEISYYVNQDLSIVCLRSAGISKTIGNTESIESRTIQLGMVPTTDEGHAALNRAFGSVVIGSCVDMVNLGTLTFSYGSGAILPVCICKFDDTHTDLGIVDSDGVYHLLDGDVSLKAGDGIDITVNNGNEVVITRVPTAAEQQQSYDNVDDVIAAIQAELGNPIYTINGLRPTADGAFTIAGGDCLNVQPGVNSLLLSNPCSKPCCSDSQTSTELAANMNQLEAASDRLTAYYEALTTNISILQARLASLIASKA